MAKTDGNDLVVKALKDEVVDTVFYLTGGPMVDVASRCIEIGFRSVDVRHEQAAAMAAHAYSRVLGKPGVCFAASGPGTTNLITGVGNAYLDAVPVVALGGASALSQVGMGPFRRWIRWACSSPSPSGPSGCWTRGASRKSSTRPFALPP